MVVEFRTRSSRAMGKDKGTGMKWHKYPKKTPKSEGSYITARYIGNKWEYKILHWGKDIISMIWYNDKDDKVEKWAKIKEPK